MEDTSQASYISPLFRSAHNAAKHLYTPILRWETRLMALYPGAPDNALVADLLTATLTHDSHGLGLATEDRIIEYDALSYTWGNPDFVCSLLCNEHTLNITRNLNNALRHLRLPDQKRFLWVDAVCINQSDDKERATQVASMFYIYQKASRAIVWLGDSSPATILAAEFMKEILSSIDFPIRRLHYRYNDSKKFGDDTLRMLRVRTEQDQQLIMSGLLDLGERAWLRRVWIVQEIYAAAALTVHFGDSTIDWGTFVEMRRVLQCIGDGRDPCDHVVDEIEQNSQTHSCTECIMWSRIAEIGRSMEFLEFIHASARDPEDYHDKFHRYFKRTYRDNSPTAAAMLLLLQQTTGHHATDDRDHIFALLGVASHHPDLTWMRRRHGSPSSQVELGTIAVDYTRTIAQVFEDMTKALINGFGDCSPLYVSWSSASDRPSIAGLPTWTPDWRTASLSHSLRSSNSHFENPDTDEWIEQTHDSTGILKMTGYILGYASRSETSNSDDVSHPEGGTNFVINETFCDIKDHHDASLVPPTLSRRSRGHGWDIEGRISPQVGDALVSVKNGVWPFVLRKRPEAGWTLVGFATMEASSYSFVLKDMAVPIPPEVFEVF